MMVRTAIGRTALRARLTAVSCGALILLGIATLSACSGSGSTVPAVSSITIISSLASSGSNAVGGSSPSSGSAGESTSPGSGTTTVTVTPTTTVTATPSPSPSPIPSYAPVTGGGGTAGFQDGLLLAIGAAAIAAGAGSIAYRRRLTRRR